MKHLALCCIFLFIPFAASCELSRPLEIEYSFDETAAGKTLVGFRLYQDAIEACYSGDLDGTMVCTVEAAEGLHIYELAAVYGDNSESPKSPPFEFSIQGEIATTATAIKPDHPITLAGDICLSYMLAGVDQHSGWSAILQGDVPSRLAITATLNKVDALTQWDDPQDRQLCWPGPVPDLGVVHVRITGYRGVLWQPDTAYAIGDQVTGDLNGFYYEVTAGGVSGSNEPAWPTVDGGSVMDGTVEWMSHDGAITYQGPRMMRVVYLKTGTNTVQKTSTNRMGGNFSVRSN